MITSKPLTVLLVEDSATVAAYVTSVLATEPSIRVLPVAPDARTGVRSALEDRPDVVLMDMQLPDHDGIWAIGEIMATSPCPIVVLSGHLSSRERDITFESLRAGAVEVLAKPTGLSAEVRKAFRNNLVHTIRLMASAVVVRRRRALDTVHERPVEVQPNAHVLPLQELAPIHYVLIGASTGGPEILSRLLTGLPAPLPFPILVTQHTLEGFDESLAQWLSTSGHRVRVAHEGELPLPGTVLLAPADRHLEVAGVGVKLIARKPQDSIASVDAMFSSAAAIWGKHCMALLLTGMGRDGARGMADLHERRALTIAQAAYTCVVPNMPESARAAGVVRRVMTPDEIASALHQLANLRSQQDELGSSAYTLKRAH